MKCSNDWNCPAGSFPYTVRTGDTLYSLAKRFESTVERLAEVNSIEDVNRIDVGQKLCIPLPMQYFPACRTTNYYVVKGGDTAVSIARYFGISTTQLLYSNIGIDLENLYDGMILCIPLAPPVLCICIDKNTLTLNYKNGDELCFSCVHMLKDISTNIVQKQLDTSVGGAKRLNLLIPETAITNSAGKRYDTDIILSDKDMDNVFNLVTVGTEVCIK